jgi:hypothetical protein
MVGFNFDKSFVANIVPFVSSIVKSGMDCDVAECEKQSSSKATNRGLFHLDNCNRFKDDVILIFLCFLK